MLHVIGAGLAGLSAAITAAHNGMKVTIHEATEFAGGRCRSFPDVQMGTTIDNGTHLVMDVNRTAIEFARAVGGIGQMQRGRPVFPFVDVATGKRWTLTPWALGQRPLDLLRAIGLFGLRDETTVAQSLGRTATFDTIWDPLNVAALNTESDKASAKQFAKLLRLALKRGLSSLYPWVFPNGLSAALVDPAVADLQRRGMDIHFRHRLRRVEKDTLVFEDGNVSLLPEDRVVLAVPPWVARDLFPSLPAMETRAIVNGHFLLPDNTVLPGGKPWLGLTGGLGQWVSVRDRVASVTVSAAEACAKLSAEQIAQTLWDELAPLLRLDTNPLPPHRIIKEKRATIAHTPAMVAQRPGPDLPYESMLLAGDWLQSDWPCTIEAAIVSGRQAVRLLMRRPKLTF